MHHGLIVAAVLVGALAPCSAYAQDYPPTETRFLVGVSKVYVDEEPFPIVGGSMRFHISPRVGLEPQVTRAFHRVFGITIILLNVTVDFGPRQYFSFGSGWATGDAAGGDGNPAVAARYGWTFPTSGRVFFGVEVGGGVPGLLAASFIIGTR